MQLDVSFLPAYGAAFILMFARLGTMIMLLPGLGERSVPVRVRLTVALVLVAAPLMLVGLIVGVVISLFQALTQIQEMTLVFVPKILAIFIAMLVALPFMGDMMQGHMTRLAARIIGG